MLILLNVSQIDCQKYALQGLESNAVDGEAVEKPTPEDQSRFFSELPCTLAEAERPGVRSRFAHSANEFSRARGHVLARYPSKKALQCNDSCTLSITASMAQQCKPQEVGRRSLQTSRAHISAINGEELQIYMI